VLVSVIAIVVTTSALAVMGLFDEWLNMRLEKIARLDAADDDVRPDDASQWISVLVLLDSAV
jgi:hypothetical protein